MEPAVRLGILVLSLAWALVPGFALIDLTTAIPPGDPNFADRLFLEGSWGLLTTVLILIPLLVVFFRPALAQDVVLHLLVVAGCCVAAAAVCVAPSYVGLAVAVVMTAAMVWLAFGQARAGAQPRVRWKWWPLIAFVGAYVGLPLLLFGPGAFDIQGSSVLVGLLALSGWLALSQRRSWAPPGAHRGRSWPLLVVALAGAGPWIGYAWSLASDYHDGVRYPGLVDRIPAQSVLALAIVVLLVVAALGALPFRLPTWTAACTGAGFGAFAVLYPDQLGSPGAGWGIAAIIWSAAVVVAAESLALRRRTGLAREENWRAPGQRWAGPDGAGGTPS